MDPEPTEIGTGPLAHWPRPLAFVLSGGGAFGATQVGMLRALHEAGIGPDLIVGSSVGALNGVTYAADPDGAVDRLIDVWATIARAGIFGGRTRLGRAWSAARHGLRRNTVALCSPDRLQAVIEANVSTDRLEQLPVTTAIVVTDALIGQPKVLSQGEIAPLLRATSAIPGIFPPVKIEGCFYVDGGVTANVPIRQAVQSGARSLVVLNANPRSMPGTLPTSIAGTVLHTSAIMLRNQRADGDDELMSRHPVLHLPQTTPVDQSSFDFDRSTELIDLAYTSTRSFLTQLPDLTDTSRRLSAEAGPTGEDPGLDAPAPEVEPTTDRSASGRAVSQR